MKIGSLELSFHKSHTAIYLSIFGYGSFHDLRNIRDGQIAILFSQRNTFCMWIIGIVGALFNIILVQKQWARQ